MRLACDTTTTALSAFTFGKPQNSALAKGSGSVFGPPYSQKQIDAAVDHCSRVYFNIRLDSFDPSRRGHNGTFNGTDLDASSTNSNVTVVNDVSAFTSKQLGNLYAKWQSGATNAPLNGLTFGFGSAGFSPYRDFTARNIGKAQSTLGGVSPREDTQIWELGNSFSYIKPNNKLATNIEPGQSFEDCVGAMLKSHIGGWK